MGMVLRRSTTDWTCPSAFNRVARSIVAFMSRPNAAPAAGYSGRAGRRQPRLGKADYDDLIEFIKSR
jgi:hypothetical protein